MLAGMHNKVSLLGYLQHCDCMAAFVRLYTQGQPRLCHIQTHTYTPNTMTNSARQQRTLSPTPSLTCP